MTNKARGAGEAVAQTVLDMDDGVTDSSDNAQGGGKSMFDTASDVGHDMKEGIKSAVGSMSDSAGQVMSEADQRIKNQSGSQDK